jgi:hypothetical protein
MDSNNKNIIAVVYILTEQPTKAYHKIGIYFDKKYFLVIYKNIPYELKGDKTKYRIIKCLKHCSIRYHNYHTIIIKDSSETVLNKNLITTKIKNVVELYNTQNPKKRWDIFYLCRWLDLCNKTQIFNKTHNIYRTYSPHGIQAIMFSVQGRQTLLGKTPLKNKKYINLQHTQDYLDTLLNKHIENKNLISICYQFNIFNFSPSYIKSDKDLAKLCLSRKFSLNTDPGISVVMYTIIVIFLLIFLIIAIYLKKKHST